MFFTKFSYYMMMENFEDHDLLSQLKDEQILIFDDIMHRKHLNPNTPICLFLTRGVATSKICTLNF